MKSFSILALAAVLFSSVQAAPQLATRASQADIDAYINGQNSMRARHGAKALAWSDALAQKAQQWTNGCKFQHSGGSLGPYGENLSAGTGGGFTIAAAVKLWTDEECMVGDTASYQTGVPSHFSQVVWKGTTQVGCAYTMCNGIFDPSYGQARFVACEYSPAGNVIGQFPQNVQM
ncbi:hypothetical protein BOTBODRAFT_145235 [Botryobasidium botryosum FD-172 SS1]|uniref:SCP domain-containing protein n=1 Tax=Botryobasidium botryosum (strain FD-172 SS1) TaxID=930990 RepID=A0A067MTK0_BOTB1|nr:hypothetical protein BOTBODRAFT_145235 [Botryobasidium botryosum FD-172 SS1]